MPRRATTAQMFSVNLTCTMHIAHGRFNIEYVCIISIAIGKYKIKFQFCKEHVHSVYNLDHDQNSNY